MLLDRALIRLDGGTQPRAAISSLLFEDYAQSIAEGAILPPVAVFFDGVEYWLADGFHRFHAHETLGLAEIEADVRQGDRRDAVLYSVGANADHGLRRSNDDKRRAVSALLQDAEWSVWSDNAIARQCKVSHTFVAKLRPAVTLTSNVASERAYRDRHQRESVMNVAAIGRSTRPPLLVGGRAPDRKPCPDLDQDGEIGIGTASRVTGFKTEKLARFARSGEIEGARKTGGAWVFDSLSLKRWMEGAPVAAVEATIASQPPFYDHEANRPMLAAIETLETLVAGVSPSALLRWWKTYPGAGFEPGNVAAAAAWINTFAEGYQAAERDRQALLTRISEEA